MKKLPNGKTLPVGGRDYNLLDLLLTPTSFQKVTVFPNGKMIFSTIKIRGTRQNIERFAHLVFE